jgi:uncharacterized Zn-binding protein involved in type VI secretion
MAQPVARQTDQVTSLDMHVVLVPSPGGPVPTPLPHPFSGTLQSNVVPTVFVNGLPVATVGTVAVNSSPHLPTPPGTSFKVPPTNQGVVQTGSATVFAGGKPVARLGDPVLTCTDVPGPPGRITSGSPTVLVG